MNRTDKLKALQGVLLGQTGHLQPLVNLRRSANAPYQDAHGILDAQSCHPLLNNLSAIDGECLIGGPQRYEPLGDWLLRVSQNKQKASFWLRGAYATIDLDDDRFDQVVLYLIHLKHKNYSITYLPDATIGDLRRYYQQCAAHVKQPFITLSIETDLSKYVHYLNPAKAI